MFKLILAAALLLSGSVLLIVAVRRFEDTRVNLALGLTSLLFLGQGTLLIGQVNSRVKEAAPSSQTAPAAASASPASQRWDQGGTLQNADLGTWRMGEYANRLASAADLLKALRQQQLFTASIRSEEDYQPWSAALVACLEASRAEDKSPIRPLVEACVADDGLRKFR